MRTLKVKCPTWRHVATFYSRKLRPDKTLTIRVPFDAETGSTIMLGLQLPDGNVIAIEGTAQGTVPGASGQKAALKLHLHGLTDEILGRLEEMVAAARGPESQTTLDDRPRRPKTRTKPPEPEMPLPPVAAVPEDAPISEDIEPLAEPDKKNVYGVERDVYIKLETELGNLREHAAHDVLGVSAEAEVDEIRRAYFACTKRYHPDLFARYRSPAVMRVAQELFIHINRAYDRMRNSLVASGRAVVAGPALLSHDGWLAVIDDIEVETEMDDDVPAPSSVQSAVLRAAEASGPVGRRSTVSDIRAKIAGLVEAGEYEAARSRVADALHAEPRNRQLRALYYVVSGKQALANGDKVLAATQLDAALAHDRECYEAREALDELRASGDLEALPRFLR